MSPFKMHDRLCIRKHRFTLVPNLKSGLEAMDHTLMLGPVWDETISTSPLRAIHCVANSLSTTFDNMSILLNTLETFCAHAHVDVGFWLLY